jgi:hypothetical protein
MIKAPYKLEFLFVAETYDGQIIRQAENDISPLDPTKSSFYDVLQHKIKRFSLVGKGMLFTVDLTDGHYEVNGNIMYTKRPPGKCKLRLVYYRQIQQRLGIGPDGSQKMQPIVRYFIGWQATFRGKNYNFELGVD